MNDPDTSAGPAEKEKGPVPFPPPVIYLAGLLLGVGAELIEPTPGLHPTVTVTAAVVFIGLAILLDGSATRLFVKNKTAMPPWIAPSALVTEGPYRYTRNPMYLGMACLYAGLAFSFGLLWAFAFLPLVIILIDRTVIAREEPYMEKKFGNAYIAYKRSVRRWI